MRTLGIPFLILVVVVAADQITKVWAVATLTDLHSISVIGDFLMFTLVYNQGGAMGTQLGPSISYLIIALLVLPLLFYFIWRHRTQPTFSYPMSFIAAGAVGNLIDRIRLGKVVDFIDVDFFDIELLNLQRWWTFNIADAAISCAILFLIVHMFLPTPSDPTEQPDQASENILTDPQ